MSDKMHADLHLAKEIVYDSLDFVFSQFIEEQESEEYAASIFLLDELRIKFRVAKITPTKVGQFVTLWKRDEKGITCPHDASDPFDFYIISVRDQNKFGHFIFPKEALLQQSILSTTNKDGKRGFRVYPPWVATDNKQAQKTQSWQKEFFLEINERAFDKERAKLLYAVK